MAQNWYVLVHDSNYHKSLVDRISNLGVEVYSPKRTTLTPRRNRPSCQRYEVVLLPGYLMLKFDPEDIHTTQITAFNGAFGFVRFGNRTPTIVPDADISKFKQILKAYEDDLLNKLPARIGSDDPDSAITFIVTDSSVNGRKASFLALMQHIDLAATKKTSITCGSTNRVKLRISY
ncbi:transcriptional regulator [Pseudomonas cichorii]|nr:transcription termination/antitermination NusG family protein [Pseudomonas cichorii]MBX8493156.1 transcriptional regulator [Pseudomonas cichorii]